MRINTNVAALNAWRNLSVSTMALQKSLEKLTSGYRINRAADDAAGLAVSEKMRAQTRGLQAAQRNAQDAISLIQTAEGALSEIHSILQRMRELAVQAASDTNTDTDRGLIQKEVTQLINEITRIAATTEFNTQKLLDGTFTSKVFQIGANNNQTITLTISDMRATALGVDSVDVSTQTGAANAILALDQAIDNVSSQRAELGAVQNRLEHTIANLGVAVENLQQAESRIRDVDMALEMARYTKYQVLVQAGTAMLAQANQAPQAVMQLLR